MSIFKDLPDVTIHFSDVLGIAIFKNDGNSVGKLKDIFVDYEEVYPSILGIQFNQKNESYYVNWKDIESFSLEKIVLKKEHVINKGITFPKTDTKKTVTSLIASQFKRGPIEFPPLGKIIIDRQVVDTSGKKVVRVNDIQFIRAGSVLRVTHAEIGVRSLIRRLGAELFVDTLVKIVKPNSKYLSGDVLINWKYVHAIPDRTAQRNVKLTLTNEDIRALHPADLADILEELDGPGRELIFNTLDPELAAKTLSEIDPEVQTQLIKDDDPEHVAKIIENMGTDEAADVLNELSKDHAEEIISNITDDETQEEIQELLEYDEDTAGGLMSTEVFTVPANLKRSSIMKRIQEEHEDLESIYDMYVVDEKQKLLGSCSLYKTLIQTEDLSIGDIMTTADIKSVPPTMHWRDIASYMSKYNLINVPVVGEDGELLGIISVDDILPWLLGE